MLVNAVHGMDYQCPLGCGLRVEAGRVLKSALFGSSRFGASPFGEQFQPSLLSL
jgi:hypothetical protein